MITDFGQSYQKIASAGTRNYRAPEAALNLAYDKPADIFAAGCVLFEIACQRQLFTATNDIELIVQQNQLIGPLSQSQTLQTAPDYSKIVLNNDFDSFSNFQQLFR